MTLADVVEALTGVLQRTGDYAPAVLFLASFIEYVFPPFPGDALVLVGSWYAVHGELSWPAAFVAVTVGGILGASIDYWIGRKLGPHLERRARTKGGADAARLAAFEASYRRWGPWLLVANRFLPTMRAFLFVLAGACRVPYTHVLVYGGISALAWNALLLGAGGLVAKNLEQLLSLFQRYTRTATVVVVVALLALAARALWKRRREGAA